MFSHLCKARLWPRKKSFESSSPSPDPSECPENEVKKIESEELVKSEDEKKKNVEPSHLEFYLSWLLKISESDQAEPNSVCTKSTLNPAYGLSASELTQRPLQNFLETKPKIEAATEETRTVTHHPATPTNSRRATPTNRQRATPTNRQRATPISLRSKRTKMRRVESSLSITGKEELRVENRVTKRSDLSRRRSNRTQRQQNKAIQEVVNMFGKQFDKALKGQKQSEEKIPITGVVNQSSYLCATLRSERLSVSVGDATIKQLKPLPVVRAEVVEASSTEELLERANKNNPAKISMVVMECTPFRSHLRKDFQESSLQMGMLVTALYRHKDWYYVCTAHGNEGFIHSRSCQTIGTLLKRKSCHSKEEVRPEGNILQLDRVNHKSAFQKVKPLSKMAINTKLNVSRPNLSFFNPESTSTLQKRSERKEETNNDNKRLPELVIIKDYFGNESESTITIKKGDIVTVLNNSLERWVYVKLETGKSGYIPRSCTTKVGFL